MHTLVRIVVQIATLIVLASSFGGCLFDDLEGVPCEADEEGDYQCAGWSLLGSNEDVYQCQEADDGTLKWVDVASCFRDEHCEINLFGGWSCDPDPVE